MDPSVKHMSQLRHTECLRNQMKKCGIHRTAFDTSEGLWLSIVESQAIPEPGALNSNNPILSVISMVLSVDETW